MAPSPSTHPSDDTLRSAAATAARLRLLQSDLADGPEEERLRHLNDTIEHAAGKLRPDQRDAFYDELERLFPSWDGNVEVTETVAAPGPVASHTDEKELRDPAFLVARLAELAPAMKDAERRVITDRLREAGLAPRAGAGPNWSEETLAKLRARLALKDGDPDAARLLEMAAVLADFVSSLDQLMWNTWKTVSPRSALRRPAPLNQSLGRFMVGDGEVGRAQVVGDVERLRQLTAALVSAVSQVGRQFAQGYLAKFSPAEITNLAGMESGGLLVSKEVKCWRKYVELAGALDETAIETEIMQALSGYAESLMKGLGSKA